MLLLEALSLGPFWALRSAAFLLAVMVLVWGLG